MPLWLCIDTLGVIYDLFMMQLYIYSQMFYRCGLQRVGVVVAAYCEYTGLCPPHHQDQSLDRFSMKRFLNERVGGLQSPSDKRCGPSINSKSMHSNTNLTDIIINRYVEYFAGLLSGTIQVNSSPLFLDHVTVVGIPAFQSNGGCRAFFKVIVFHVFFSFQDSLRSIGRRLWEWFSVPIKLVEEENGEEHAYWLDNRDVV